MRKLLKPQDILLLCLASALDVFEEVRDPFQVFSKSYENMYGSVPSKFKRKNFNHLIWRSLKTNYIEKTIKNGEVYLRITSKGVNKVKKDFPLLQMQKIKWDNKWRLIFFDIEEIHKLRREGLRKKLKELGFGMLQKSVFITPHDFTKDLLEFLESYGLKDCVYVIEVPDLNIYAGNIKELVNRIWDLDKLNQKYKELVEKIVRYDLTTKGDRIQELNGLKEGSKNLSGDDMCNSIYKEYLAILMRDPFLPKELLPEDWARERVKKFLKN